MITARSNGILISKKPFKVLVCLVTLVAFLCNTILSDVTWAVGTSSGLPGGSSDRSGGSGFLKELHVDTFALPENLGRIKDQYKANNPGKTIIHIQDAHCNYAAQHKISEIIGYLNKEYGIDTINLEGGAKGYNISIFTDIADKAKRERASDHFVKEGLVNGAEYYAINNPDKVNLWGIEDTNLYIDNLKVYRSSLTYKEEVDRYLKDLSQILSSLKAKIYSEGLLNFDMNYGAYKAGNIDLKDYLNSTITIAKSKTIDIKTLTNIYLLSQTLGEEAGIDFKKANIERDSLIDNLQKRLSKNAIDELVIKTVQFKSENISQKDFYSYLVAKAKEKSIPLSEFSELRKYIVYISMYDAIDKSRLMEEMDALEDKVRDSLCINDNERQLSILSKNLSLLKNVFGTVLTKDDYRYYKDNERSFDVRNFIEFINKSASKYNITVQLDDNIQNLDKYRKEIGRFFEYSLKRDDAFLKNMKSPPSGNGAVILVTGGFHTENLAEIFKKKGISYISIMPNFRNDDGYDCPYFNILAGRKAMRIKDALPSVFSAGLATWSQLSPTLDAAVREAGLETPVARFEVTPTSDSASGVKSFPAGEEIATKPVTAAPGQAAKPASVKPTGTADQSRKMVYIYFSVYIALTTLITLLSALTINWLTSSLVAGVISTIITFVIFSNPAESATAMAFSFYFKLTKGPLEFARMNMSDGIPDASKTLLSYMLLSESTESSEETFKNMYTSYMNNLDPNANVTAVLVSVTKKLSVLEEEMDMRDIYRQKIRQILIKEALAYRDGGKAALEPGNPRIASWALIFARWEREGLTGRELENAINGLAEKFANNFKYLHRTTRVLKKAGQYQDLFVLASRGIELPYVYIDEKYGDDKREAGLRAFGFIPEKNVEDDIGVYPDDYLKIVNDLERRGRSDVEELMNAGATYGTGQDRSYRYTVLCDQDNIVPPESVRTLTEIAAANPDRGALQPAVKSEGVETWSQWKESLAHIWGRGLPEAFFRVFGRGGLYGKAMINNNFYIDTIIGTPEKPIEALQINVLSHDTIEGIYLNPAYIPFVKFIENPTRNYLSRIEQLLRWTPGDLLNAAWMLKPVKQLFAFLRGAYNRITGSKAKEPWIRPIEKKHGFIPLYIANFPSKTAVVAPIFLLWLAWRMAGSYAPDLLNFRYPMLQIFLFILIFKIVAVIPKLFDPAIDLAEYFKAMRVGDYPGARLRLKNAGLKFSAGVVEIIISPFFYIPQIIMENIIIARSAAAVITGKKGWQKSQKDKEAELMKPSLLSILRNIWYVPAAGLVLLGTSQLLGVSLGIWNTFIAAIWITDVLAAWLGSREVSPRDRKGFLFKIAEVRNEGATKRPLNEARAEEEPVSVAKSLDFNRDKEVAETAGLPRVSIVVLNYNSAPYAAKLMESLAAMSHDNFNFDLVIVDNASNRLDFRRLTYAAEKSGIKTTIMRLNRNAGGSARNFGIRAARENASDYVLLMDSDTIVSDRDALKTLVDRASRSSADEVAFGPTVYVAGSKGEVWASGAQFPDLNDTTRYDNEKYKYVDFFPSAAVMIKASAFEKIGMFDDRFFIYYEDTDWFMRAADNGLKSVLVPGAGIDHAIGKGFGGGRFNAQRIYHSTRGRILFMKKYGDINDPKKLIRLLLSVAKSILGSIVISRSIEGAKAAIKATYDGLVEQYPEYESVRPKTIPLVVPAPTPTGKSYEYNIRDILLTFVRRMASLGLLWLGMQTVGANGGKEAPAPAALPTSVTDKPQSNVRAISDSTPASGARKSIIDADEGLSAAEKQSLLDEAKRLQKISSQVDVPMPDGSVETLMVCRIGFAELDRATQELLRTRGIAGAYNITDAVTGTVYIFTDESLTDIDMAVRHEELEAAWRAILLRSPPDKKLLRRLSSVGRDPIERAAHILASASLQNMAFIRTQLNRPDITAEQLQSLLNEDRSLHRDVIWVYLSGMEEDNRRFEAGVRAEIRRTLQKPIPSSETPAPKPVRTGALEYAAAPDVATPGSDTVAKPISDVKTSMLDDVASLAKPETADDRSVIVRKMTEKVKKYGARQALNAVDRMIEKYLGQRADLEMALRTAVMVNGIGDIGKAEHLNIVVQIAGPGESNKARSPIQDIKNKLENYPYNIYAQSILEEGVDNQDNLKEVIDRLMTSLQDPANKDPRVLLLLPEHLHPYFNFAKDYLKANGINVDEPGAQVKIQKIEQGSDPDLVTQFGLGFEIIEYDRLTDEAKKDENNYRGLLDLLAAMADGQDPKDILNDLFKGILKIRKINWQSAVEQRKSWEAVARSL